MFHTVVNLTYVWVMPWEFCWPRSVEHQSQKKLGYLTCSLIVKTVSVHKHLTPPSKNDFCRFFLTQEGDSVLFYPLQETPNFSVRSNISHIFAGPKNQFYIWWRRVTHDTLSLANLLQNPTYCDLCKTNAIFSLRSFYDIVEESTYRNQIRFIGRAEVKIE